MLELLNNLTPTERALIAGAVVFVLMWLGRLLAKGWFADESNVAKAQKRILSIAVAGFAAIGICSAAGGCNTEQFILNWFVAWATSQGAHSLAKTRLTGG